MMVGEAQFVALAQQRLDDFYRLLAHTGEVAPGPRFRLEGFLDAGLALQLVEPQQLAAMIAASYRAFMGQSPPSCPLDDVTVMLPVRWQRAPVYAAGSKDKK
jgi:hypothetical protein